MYILMDQFLTTTIVWGHVITLPSDTVYHVTLQISGYYMQNFITFTCVVRIRAISYRKYKFDELL